MLRPSRFWNFANGFSSIASAFWFFSLSGENIRVRSDLKKRHMWIHSTPRIHIPAVEAIFTGRDIILFFFFYGLTHLSAVTLNHSVLCPVKFYCTWKCWLIVKPVILSHAMTQQQFHLKRVQFVFFFFFGQCFKDHLLKWTFLFKLDSFFNHLKDKHHQGEVKRRLRGHRSEAERKCVCPDSTEGEQAVRKNLE